MYKECYLTLGKLPQSNCSGDTYGMKDVQKSGHLVNGVWLTFPNVVSQNSKLVILSTREFFML